VSPSASVSSKRRRAASQRPSWRAAIPASSAVRDIARVSQRGRPGSLDDRADDGLLAAEEEDAGVRLEAVARIVAQGRRADLQDAAAVVADEEDRPAALTRVVARHSRAGQQDAELVAVRVQGAPRASAGRIRARGVGAAADRAIAAEDAVVDRPRDA